MNLTTVRKLHAERMLAHLEDADRERRERVESYLDNAAAAMELAKTSLRHALKAARTTEGRDALEAMIAKLDEVGDDHRASSSGGQMCAAYEAEVRS